MRALPYHYHQQQKLAELFAEAGDEVSVEHSVEHRHILRRGRHHHYYPLHHCGGDDTEAAHEEGQQQLADRLGLVLVFPVDEYQQLFTKYLDQGYDIVYIACSSKQSGSVNTAAVVANKLMETYKDNKIFCIDSLNSSFSEGILAIEASKFASMDKSAEEVAEWVMTHKKTIHEFCTVHSLDALHRAGRVKASAAFFGNLLGVKPIIVSDYNGEQAAFKKVKGRANSIREIVMLLKDALLNSENQTIYVSHADCSQEEVDQIVSIIKKEIPCKDICIGYIGPIIGASIGPDAIAVYGFGKPVTFNKGE